MRYILILLGVMGFALPAHAQQQPQDVLLEAGKAVFSDMERQVIRDVLNRVGLPAPETRREGSRDDDENEEHGAKKHKDKGKKKHKGLPPGLAKKKQLPPGLAKRQSLPPGLQKQALPEEVTRHLPPPPKGTERVIVDNDVVLVEKGTQIVLDIIRDVIAK